MKEYEREPIKYNSLEDLVNSNEPDKIRGKSRCNFEKAEKYQDAISKLEILKQKGYLDFEYEKASEKLNLHAIHITWKFSDNDPYLSIKQSDMEILTEILSEVDSLTLDEDSSNWMLSSTLYVMAD